MGRKHSSTSTFSLKDALLAKTGARDGEDLFSLLSARLELAQSAKTVKVSSLFNQESRRYRIGRRGALMTPTSISDTVRFVSKSSAK